jgi:hypothetical protein
MQTDITKTNPKTLAQIRNELHSTNPIQTKRRKRTLHTWEQERIDKLQSFINQLNNDDRVQNRTLQTWLWDWEYAQYLNECDFQSTIRIEISDKPDAIKQYESRLKKAIFLTNRRDTLRKKKNMSGAYTLDTQIESECEDILEYLQDIIAEDETLRSWFDRQLDFGAGSDLGADVVSLPRIVTSRSTSKQGNGHHLQKLTKKQVKIKVLQSAIDSTLYEDDDSFVQTPAQQERRRLLLLIPHEREPDIF